MPRRKRATCQDAASRSVEHFEYLIPALLVAVAALSALATRLGVPYPIPLLVGGVVIGLIPGIPHIELPPELVLAILLPPLLYSAAFFANLRDLRADLRAISLLAVGLVLATTVAVAVAIHVLVPAMPWAVAFALGAIVSPTDPLAASEIARRQNAPRRVISIVEGESLINDGTALTAYNVAVAAAVGGAFDLLDASRTSSSARAAGSPSGSRSAGSSRSCAAGSTTRPWRSRSRSSRATPPTCRPRRSTSPGCSPPSRAASTSAGVRPC